MTRVIWDASMETYTGCTLAELRAMKTHGEKRVRAILEVFHCVHNLVAGMEERSWLRRRIDESHESRSVTQPISPCKAG